MIITSTYFSDRGHCFKGDEMAGGKKAKDRITVLLCCNMTGSEKRPLVVIGKSKSPRCFPKDQSKLPVTYKFSYNAWMTGDIFRAWLKQWDSSLRLEEREIALVLDNCSAHPRDVSDELTNIRLYFLPPNTTSIIQPLDMGIIKTWKGCYRSLINRRIIASLDADLNLTAASVSKSINLLQSINYAADAWQKIKPLSISNCYRKAGFAAESVRPASTESQEEDVEIVEVEDSTDISLERLGYTQEEFDKFVIEESHLTTSGELSNAELLAAAAVIHSGEREQEPDDVDLDDGPALLTKKEKLVMIDLLRRYIQENPDLKSASFVSIERSIFAESIEGKKQTVLDTFFNRPTC